MLERLPAIVPQVFIANPKYTFDIFFGLSTVEPKRTGGNSVDISFLLLTEALNGAGLSTPTGAARELEPRTENCEP